MEPAGIAFRLRAAPAAVFVDLLREAGRPLDARALKDRLERLGVARSVVDAAWRTAQPGLRRHGDVAYDATRGAYVYGDGRVPVPALGPEEALERLLPGALTARRTRLAGIVRAALGERAHLEARVRDSYQTVGQVRAAHERQLRIDAVRALAETAMEVEELAAAGADAWVMVERIRALVKAFDLVPIGRSGDQTAFDPSRHAPIGATVISGTRVSIIRPGYSWRHHEEDVLLAKAQVAPLA